MNFPQYERYKESGVEWLGEVPGHWEVKRLKTIAQSLIGIIYTPDDVRNEGEGTLVLRASNIQDGKLSFVDNVYVDKKINDRDYVRAGDILVCARNGSEHLVGKCAYLDAEHEKHTFGAFMSIVRSEQGRFLYHYFWFIRLMSTCEEMNC